MRYRKWLAALRGTARIVVGTRSAVFAPTPETGLVVVWDDGDDNLSCDDEDEDDGGDGANEDDGLIDLGPTGGTTDTGDELIDSQARLGLVERRKQAAAVTR